MSSKPKTKSRTQEYDEIELNKMSVLESFKSKW